MCIRENRMHAYHKFAPFIIMLVLICYMTMISGLSGKHKTQATGSKPPDNQDASDPGPSSNKNAAGLGLSDRKEGTSSGPSQKASSMSYAAALINKGTMPCFLNQCKSVFFFFSQY